MSKYTPGPWWRDDDGFIASGNGDTYVTVADANVNSLDIDEREANTSLIAAAPELLAALKNAAKILDDDGARDGYSGKESYDDAADAARAAIARAEGGE